MHAHARKTPIQPRGTQSKAIKKRSDSPPPRQLAPHTTTIKLLAFLPTMRHAALLGVGFALCLLRAQAQPYDYPTAKPSTTWANTDAALRHHVAYTDGSVARAALLRLNPARLGPSFAFGFFCTNHRAGAPCADFLLGVAVVYCNSGAGITAVTTGIPQVVWSANRAVPVGDGATAELTADGDLVLRSPGGKVLWSAGAAGRGVSGMSINSDGNLVLFDGSNRTVWQSFDHPTDTLVVGQSLKQGARLTANASFDNSSEGRIYLAVADDGLAAYVDAKPPQRYYVLGYSKNAGAYAAYTNGSLAVLDRPGGQQLATVQLPAVAAGTVQYMRLEHDGHLRLYEWRSNGMRWEAAGDVLHPYPGDCAYPTVCGAYGVCTDMQCSCPDAANFRAVDFRRPNRGCVPTSPPAPPATCRSRRARHRLVSLRDTAYFNSHDTSMRTLERVGEAACKAACLGDCACMAAQFVYGFDPNDGFCYLQSEVLSLETMQPEVFHYNSSMHIKIAQGRLPRRF
ncbi:EP1-like glycoprotein 2 [Oryza glaberrima]|nr:EP1-like glycoprotein 2 [Oryza glaberrima]